ncbi:MAG: methionine--tRNA ligase, partial [Chlamydiota bacterium]
AARSAVTHQDMANTIGCSMMCLKALALISSPVIPATAEKVWHMLGFDVPLDHFKWDEILNAELPAGRKLPPPQILFTRVEDAVIEAEVQKLKSSTS